MKLSIIIPTCNERAFLHKTINAALNHASGNHSVEILVIDCGSTDGTTENIRQKSVVVVTNPSLAGKKWASLRLGARLAQGDVFLFLDADTLLPPDYDDAIDAALTDKAVVGGAFEFDFAEQSPALSLVVFINRIRYRIRNRFYGDQGIFVRRQAYFKSGGWPERQLMEAAYLCDALRKQGKLKLLNTSVRTSARRFLKGGVFRVLLHDMQIWFRDLLGLDVQQYGKRYWAYNQHSQQQSLKHQPARESSSPAFD
ncbi:glycosyltransferase [Cesiribacter andamanensis]|uniref:N-glycosyltransferase n=1 Tax=Cesiribacter andamanensis AMV16 TaxID=1279009 RepID=M7N773_9BACT|nr:glycosyltransferase [Cesiribacter andamanensis]EMR04463.1 N-glycosyltransferase [Cesiribacter andamanensis AMV16]